MSFAITCRGKAVERAALHVPGPSGVPHAEIDFVDDAATAADATGLRVRDQSGSVVAEFVGVLPDERSGTFALRHRARLILGAGGWGKPIPAKAYQNPVGVTPGEIARDAARDAGEILGSFSGNGAPGAFYTRDSVAPASQALRDAAGEIPWWVGYDGRTIVGPRGESDPAPDSYRVLDFDPRLKLAKIGVDSPISIVIGSRVKSDRFSGGVAIVQALDIEISSKEIIAKAYCGLCEISPLADAVRALVLRELASHLFGAFRYRVVVLQGNRLDLQAVSKAPGLPDLLSLDAWPGVGGVLTTPALSSEVMVEFEGGNRNAPFVSHFVNSDGAAGIPAAIAIGKDGQPAARQNDAVTIILPPMVINGTMLVDGNPTPFSAVGITSTGQAIGSITSGSKLLTIATAPGGP